MDEEYGLEELAGFLQEIAQRKEQIQFQLDFYDGDDEAVLDLREKLESRLERLNEKEEAIGARVDAIMAALEAGGHD
ncbi:hypothetical protein [Cupriavidus necator]